MKPQRRVLASVLMLAAMVLAAEGGWKGRVTAGGKAIPGAVVTVKQGEKSWTTVSDEGGGFVLEGVAEGAVTVDVRMFGFQPLHKEVKAEERGAALELGLTLRAYRAPSAGTAVAAGGTARQGAVAVNALQTEMTQAMETQAAAPVTLAGSNEGVEQSFLVQGSLSSGMQMQERPGMEMMGMMMGGPGGPGGMMGGPGGGMGGESGGLGGAAMGGGGGFGGAGGGGFGGAGGFGGGQMGGRGGGAPMGGGGREMGMGGPGGPGGRPGGPMANMSAEEREKFQKQMAARMAERREQGLFGNRNRRVRDQIRGMANLTVRNDALDATPFSINGKAATKPSYTQERFGVSLGGPMSLGKYFKPDANFFFVNYNGSRGDNGYTSYQTLPDASMRSGDFSQLSKPATIYDPTSNTPFAGNVIPAARISSIAKGLALYIPQPNQTGATQNYAYSTAVPQTSDTLNVRWNRTLTKKDRLAVNVSWQRRNGESANAFGWTDQTSGSGMNYSVNGTHNFTARFMTNVHAGYNRNHNETLPYFAYGADVAGQLGIQGTSRVAANFGPPTLNFTNYGDLTDGNRSVRAVNGFNAGNSWTYVKGKHTLAAGFDWSRSQQNSVADPNGRGTLFFGGLATSQITAAGLPVSGTGNDYADFLLGMVQQSTIRYGAADSYMRSTTLGVFGQDEWRVSPKVTLTLGLRWDDWEPATEKYGRLANLALAPGLTGVSVVSPGMTNPYGGGSTPSGMIYPDRNNFSPRGGIAYRPFKKKRTILRAGYSIFYDSSVFSRIPSRLVSQPPFAVSSTYNTSTAAPLQLWNPFVGPVDTTISNSYAVNPNYRTPYAQTWSASVQHDISGYIVDLGYVGTKGTALVVQRIPNRAAPGSPLSSEGRRPVDYATGFTYESPEGNSIFHSGQIRVFRRMRRGINWNASYTLSKSIDNASSVGGSGSMVVQDDSNLAAERGLSSFDHRHALNFTGQFTSPFGPQGMWMRQKNALTSVLKEWNLSTNFHLQSGAPLTARVLGNVADAAGSGATGSARADATGLAIDSGSGYFNTAAFTTPPANRYGNAGRNTIPGPGSLSLNLSFGRSWQIGESSRHRIEGRLEAQNVLNHVNITSYGTVVNAVNYGLATGAGQMRSVQATVRVRF